MAIRVAIRPRTKSDASTCLHVLAYARAVCSRCQVSKKKVGLKKRGEGRTFPIDCDGANLDIEWVIVVALSVVVTVVAVVYCRKSDRLLRSHPSASHHSSLIGGSRTKDGGPSHVKLGQVSLIV